MTRNGPVILIDDLVDLQADPRIPAHALDFLADGREAIDAVTIRIEGEMIGTMVGGLSWRSAEDGPFSGSAQTTPFRN
jgi:hypothetical protein